MIPPWGNSSRLINSPYPLWCKKKKRICFVTLEWQYVQALQTVPARWGETVPFGQAALSTGQHSSRRDDPWGGNLAHLLVQLLNLSLLGGLQSLNLSHVSDDKKTESTRCYHSGPPWKPVSDAWKAPEASLDLLCLDSWNLEQNTRGLLIPLKEIRTGEQQFICLTLRLSHNHIKQISLSTQIWFSTLLLFTHLQSVCSKRLKWK